jgi:hypothetical protein
MCSAVATELQYTQETNMKTSDNGGLLNQEETHAIVAKK